MKVADFVHRLVPTCVHVDEFVPPNSSFKPNHPNNKPTYLVQRLHHLLLKCNMHQTTTTSKAANKKKHSDDDLSLKLMIKKVHEILYGNTETLPDQKARTEVTMEMFKESPTSINHPFRLLINCFKKMDLESKGRVTQIVENLLNQMVNSHMIACEYLEENLDILDTLIEGSFNFYAESAEPGAALFYGKMLRMSIARSQIVAKHVLESGRNVHVKKFLEEVQHPDFSIASYVMTTFEWLLTKHRSTVAEFLKNNSEWFFAQYNTELLESYSQNILTRFHALQIMENMLLSLGKDHVAINQFLSSEHNLKIIMNLLREIEKSSELAKQKNMRTARGGPQSNEMYIQAKRNAFKIFKLFVDNQNKTEKVVRILCLNKQKICKFLLEEFKIEEDEQFEEAKAQVIREIEAL